MVDVYWPFDKEGMNLVKEDKAKLEVTCETCVSYDGMKSEYLVDCLAHFAKPTLSIDQARNCEGYQTGGKE